MRFGAIMATILFGSSAAGCGDTAPAPETAADRLDKFLADLQTHARAGKAVSLDQAAEARKLAAAVHPEVAESKSGDVRGRLERLAEVERFVDEARALSNGAEGRPGDFVRADQALGRARDRLAEAAGRR
jgi:hypothetical protein